MGEIEYKNSEELVKKNDRDFKIKAALFYGGLSGFSILGGFAGTIIMTRKQDPKYFSKGMVGALDMTETGASLALRALGWGSLYAVTGCSILFFAIWKISGANNFAEFRQKMGSSLPRLTPSEPSTSRTEFSSIRDFMNYVSQPQEK